MRDGMPESGGKAVSRFRFASPVLAGILVSLSLWGGPLAASAHEKHKHPAAAPPPGAQGELCPPDKQAVSRHHLFPDPLITG